MVLNQELCDQIVQTSLAYYSISVDELNSHAREQYTLGRKIDKVSTAQSLKHFVRDWTEAGLVERDVTFPCLLHTLKKLFPDGDAKVLLPGSGLNRLAHEIAELGMLHGLLDLHRTPLTEQDTTSLRMNGPCS